MTKPIIDDRTLEACQRGDPEAFRLLFEAHKDRVYSIALCFFDGDEAAAKDITQEVFLKLMTFISQFQNRSEFSTWLHRIVTNACLDRKRALRRFFFVGEPPGPGTRASRVSHREKKHPRKNQARRRKEISPKKTQKRDVPSSEC